jgi:tRNA threonylcarbamoyladenosine biosynthesis protein TsaE
MSKTVEFSGVTLDGLSQIAAELHSRLPTRVVIALRGTLGAGKTRFAQSIAVAAGIDVADVTSPTFTIVQHYHGQRLIHHIDAYRLADEDEFIELGGEELLESDAMVLIEWPDRVGGCLPRRALSIELEIEGCDGDEGGDFADGSAGNATRTLRLTSQDAGLMQIAREVADAIARRPN